MHGGGSDLMVFQVNQCMSQSGGGPVLWPISPDEHLVFLSSLCYVLDR